MLDPAADPRTTLGELRARHLPVWTTALDSAFPPAVCGSAWELDAIAGPVSGVDVARFGHPPTMAALSVMRYEHQVSRALASPSPLGQLCVAVSSVGSARTDALSLLASRLGSAGFVAAPTAFAHEVTIIAVSPLSALAVACVVHDASATLPALDDLSQRGGQTLRLRAYLMAISSGLEDRVADISYRVARVEDNAEEGCAEAATWKARWDDQVQAWLSEGQIWTRVGRTLTASGMCESPPPEGPQECPADWPG